MYSKTSEESGLRTFFIILAAVAALTLGLNLALQHDVALIAIDLFLAELIYLKMSYAHMQVEGHGVLSRRRDKKILGIPWPITIIYAFLLTLILLMGMPTSGLLPQTVRNFEIAAGSMLVGWFAAVVHWYYYAYHATYFLDEAAERQRCKTAGYSPEKTERHIAACRQRGIFRPPE